MADAPYHTTSDEEPPEHRAVYHNYNDCYEGKKIKPWNRVAGTGGKQRCKVCIKMD
jgi:hypothetical protein